VERGVRSLAALVEGGVWIARRSAVASTGEAVTASLASAGALPATLGSNVRISVQRGGGVQVAPRRAPAQREQLATMSPGSASHVPPACGEKAAKRNAGVRRKVRSCAVTPTAAASAKETGSG
jgi:hypothetical protein